MAGAFSTWKDVREVYFSGLSPTRLIKPSKTSHTTIIKASSGSCEGRWEQWLRGGSRPPTLTTLTTTLQFKYKVQLSVHAGTEPWTSAGSYCALFDCSTLTLFVNSAKKSWDPLFALQYNQIDRIVNGALISFASHYYFCTDCSFCWANTAWMCIGGWWTLPDPVTKLSSCRGNKEEQLSINSQDWHK